MSSKIVKYTLDRNAQPTPEQIEELQRLAAMPEDQIDLSDIPELTPEQLARMKRADLYRPIKQQVTARLDADVLAWLKERPKPTLPFRARRPGATWRAQRRSRAALRSPLLSAHRDILLKPCRFHPLKPPWPPLSL